MTTSGEAGDRVSAREGLLVTAIYLAITVALAWPLATHPASSVMPGDPDTDLFMWTLSWNTHAITSQPFSIFDANIYFPYARTLAFSENLLGSLPFAAPVLWFGGSPLLALNVVALSSIVLSGLGGYVLGRKLHLSSTAAFICGMACAFSPARFFRLGQLHLTTIQWIPFCLAYVHAYLDGRRRRDLWLAMAFFSMQALASGHGGVYLTVAILIVLAWRFALEAPLDLMSRVRDPGVVGALLLLPAALVFVPYKFVQNEQGLRRSLADWQTTPQSFISSVTPLHQWVFSHLVGPDFSAGASAHLFPGFMTVMLAAIAVLFRRPRAAAIGGSRVATVAGALVTVAAAFAVVLAGYFTIGGPFRGRIFGILVSIRAPWRLWVAAAALIAVRAVLARHVPITFHRRLVERLRTREPSRPQDIVSVYLLMTVVAVLLSSGPPLGIWPYVHELPGLNFIRVPSRFMLLGGVSLSVLAAIGFERMTRSVSSAKGAAAIVSILMIAECYTMPLPAYRRYHVRIPEADRWLATQPRPFVVAEMPTTRTNDRLQSTYMLHSMAHWQKTVHGHSGLRTQFHNDLYAKLQWFPSNESLRALADLGVTYVVVHREMYEPDEWRQIDAALPGVSQLRGVYDDGLDRVYALVR